MASTITATEFFLSLLFALACLWMRRNPSNFLRFVLSPFGGLHVERWPRFILLLTRGVAIPGFVVFLLAVVNSVSPLSRDDLPTGADYLKLGIVVVISFLALRGASEEFLDRAGSPQPHCANTSSARTLPPMPPH